jgi:hypothetical protein
MLPHSLEGGRDYPRICNVCWKRVKVFVEEFQANSKRREELFDLILSRKRRKNMRGGK